MNYVSRWLVSGILFAAAPLALAQSGSLQLPKSVEAGSAFSIQTTGGDKAVLYIVGPSQVLKKEVQPGGAVVISAGELQNAGHYVAAFVGGPAAETGAFDVTPQKQPANVSFLAKPSRISVSLHDGISGAVYVFDAYHNLITAPLTVSFQLSGTTGSTQERSTVTHYGSAWTTMDSANKDGAAQFVARVGNVSSTRASKLICRPNQYATAVATQFQMVRW
jgi:hypothetical protein